MNDEDDDDSVCLYGCKLNYLAGMTNTFEEIETESLTHRTIKQVEHVWQILSKRHKLKVSLTKLLRKYNIILREHQ